MHVILRRHICGSCVSDVIYEFMTYLSNVTDKKKNAQCSISPFHSEKLHRMISSCPDASPLWKRFASDQLIRQITRISDPMQLSSDANVTVKARSFFFRC